MTLAFLTGALAAGMAVAGLSAFVIWIITLVSGSAEPWTVAIWLVPLLAALATVATYVAEVVVERTTQTRKRSTGEPWAYREDDA
jgi:hypothetical protein